MNDFMLLKVIWTLKTFSTDLKRECALIKAENKTVVIGFGVL